MRITWRPHRSVALVAIVIAFCAVDAASNKPKTVDEAVQILKTKWLKPKDLDWILRNPKDQVVWTLYRPFGTGVRNEFGLLGRQCGFTPVLRRQRPGGLLS